LGVVLCTDDFPEPNLHAPPTLRAPIGRCECPGVVDGDQDVDPISVSSVRSRASLAPANPNQSHQKSLNLSGASRVDRGASDRPMAQPVLNRPGVVPLVGVAAGVPQLAPLQRPTAGGGVKASASAMKGFRPRFHGYHHQ
jgi:hypothetical protein